MTERAGWIAAPVAVALFVLIGLVSRDTVTTTTVLAGVGAVLVCALLTAITADTWTLVVGLATAALGISLVCSGDPANIGWFALCVLAGWCALRARTVHAVAFGAWLLVLLLWQWLGVSDETGWVTWSAGTIFTIAVCALARRQGDLLAQLREAQGGLAERTRAEERNRIAGEMHDVIGHALTVSLLHVTSARLALDEDPEVARASLAEAERLGQQSLAEVRQAVGLLRDQHASSVTPMPHATDVAELVESFRRAGRPVHLDVTGEPASLTATVGLVVYRITQEALTNVVRHAPDATAWVRLEIAPGATHLTIDDDGIAPGLPADDDAGSGIPSMRERAQALGGHLTAGPSSAGWRVDAVLPRVADRALG